MKQKITKQANQNLLDISLMATGSIESVFDVSLQNNLGSITDDIDNGTIIGIDVEPVNNSVFRYYAKYKIKPATAKLDECFDALLTEENQVLTTENGQCII